MEIMGTNEPCYNIQLRNRRTKLKWTRSIQSASVLSRIKPTDQEKQKLSALADSLISRITPSQFWKTGHQRHSRGLNCAQYMAFRRARPHIFIMFPPDVSKRKSWGKKGSTLLEKWQLSPEQRERYASTRISMLYLTATRSILSRIRVASASEIIIRCWQDSIS